MWTFHCPNLETLYLSMSPTLTFKARVCISQCIVRLLDTRPNLLKVNISNELAHSASDFSDLDSNPSPAPMIAQDLLSSFPTRVTVGRRQSFAVFQTLACKCPRF
ncbi:uncharacterized protein EI90DRAFT_3027708 [Cantharellus anzutake]|uniref:uncharacterized protein n=1 Tax=Cantharellus anzutake TaxID=1750568 RepID=UPI0019042BC2|nr:uncharacterized protein EI90DRAFT_3027708 [Cantharellus anzutake]KAF8343967.1 hypothetical protein EI90DRAFT_3027708 [Cantharellus anzutake]